MENGGYNEKTVSFNNHPSPILHRLNEAYSPSCVEDDFACILYLHINENKPCIQDKLVLYTFTIQVFDALQS